MFIHFWNFLELESTDIEQGETILVLLAFVLEFMGGARNILYPRTVLFVVSQMLYHMSVLFITEGWAVPWVDYDWCG